MKAVRVIISCLVLSSTVLSLPRSGGRQSPVRSPLRHYQNPPDDPYYVDEEYAGSSYPYVEEEHAYSSRSPGEEKYDVTERYNSFPALVLVAISTSISAYFLLSLLCQMVFSFIPVWVTLITSFAMSLSVFLKSDLSVFSKALGVVLLELIRKSRIHVFISDLNRYISAAIYLKERKAYPPCENPWKYESLDEEALQFNQYRAMAAAICAGAFAGWSVTKPIPLVPSWLVGLGTGVSSGYVCTLRDSRGDLARFLANSLLVTLQEIRGVAEDASLGLKFSRVSSQTTDLLTRMDGQYHVVEKVKKFLSAAFSFFQMAMNRVKSDIEEVMPMNYPREEVIERIDTLTEEHVEAPYTSGVGDAVKGRLNYRILSYLI